MLSKMVLCIISIITFTLAAYGAEETNHNYWEASTSEELIKAALAMKSTGGTIELKPGNYLISETISFNKVNHCTIKGSGWNTTIQKIGDGNAFEFIDCGFTFIRDLIISGDGNAKTGSGIVFKGYSSSNTIDTCRISGNAISGVRFEGDSKNPQSANTVKYCHFIDNRTDQLWSQNNNDFYIIGNQFGAHNRRNELAPHTGVILDHSSAGTYTLNYHWENVVAMKMMPGCHFNRIENNRFENSRKQGVIIGAPDGEGCYMNIIIGNTFHTNSMGDSGKYNAVEAFNAHQTTFSLNQIFSWNSKDYLHKSSLVIDSTCSKWIVKDNIMNHNSAKPLVYNINGKHKVKDNIID